MPGLFGAGIAGDAEQHRGIITRQAYRTGEKAAGISSLFSCQMGRTPVWGGHGPPGLRDASRTRARSLRSLYTVYPGVDERVQPAELTRPAGRQG